MVKVMKVNPSWTANDLTREALYTWSKAGLLLPTTNPEDYVLRGKGREYIVGEYNLYEYKVSQMLLEVKCGNFPLTTPPFFSDIARRFSEAFQHRSPTDATHANLDIISCCVGPT